MKVKKQVTVNAPVDVVYAAWHNFGNFPSFMEHIEDVRVVSGGRSHWKAKGPLGVSVEWDAEITLDKEREAIGWRSIPGGSGITTAGRVNFEDRGGGTLLDVTIEYAAPAGPLGDIVARIFSDPERLVEQDLQRFREAMEAGAQFAAPRSSAGETYGSSMGDVSAGELDRIAQGGDGASAARAPEQAG